MSEITFETFHEEDIPALTPIMKRAFDEDTRIHLGEAEGGPDGYDTGEFLRKWGLHPGVTPKKILLDGKLVGGVFLWINPKTKENTLGTIFLDPSCQDKGIGKRVWAQVERDYPDTRVWRTETPIFSHRNHAFYVNGCGFHVVRIEDPKEWRDGQFLLEKRMPVAE